MSKRLILLLTLVFVAAISLAAYAEVQNVKVSGDILVQGVNRSDLILRKDNNSPLDGTSNNWPGFDHSIRGILSHTRVRIDADLTDNVSTAVRLINERVWDAESNVNTDIDLDLAYVSMKEFLYSPLSVVIGRQELSYGNGLIIGDPDTNGIAFGHVAATGALPPSLDDLSLRKAFDAVKAILNYDPLVVDLVYSKVSEANIDQDDDVDLYGINANYALTKKINLEGYFWQKVSKKAGPARQGAGGTGWAKEPANNDVVKTLGGLVRVNAIPSLNVSLEGAIQMGVKVNNATMYPNDDPLLSAGTVNGNGGKHKRQAYALQLISRLALADLMPKGKRFDPMLSGSHTVLSGEPYRSNNKHWNGWDPMYENQAGGTLANKILGYSNAQIVNIGSSLKPMEDLKFNLDWTYYRLIKDFREYASGDANNVILSGIIGDPTYMMMPGKKTLGNEVDTALTYDYTEDVQLGLSCGWFFPGEAFSKHNRETASQVIGSMKVTF